MAKPVDMFDLRSGAPAPLEGDLQPKPQVGARLSRKIVWLVIGAGVVLLAIFIAAMANYDNKKAGAGGGQDEKKDDPAAARQADVSGLPKDLQDNRKGAVVPSVAPASGESPVGEGAPKEGVAAMVGGMGGLPALGQAGPGGKPGVGAPGVGASVPGAGTGLPPGNAAGGANGGQLSPEQQMALRAKQMRDERMIQARTAGLEVRGYDKSGATSGVGSAPSALAAGQRGAPGTTGASLGGLFGSPSGVASAVPNSGQMAEGGDQEQKLSFLKTGGNAPSGYHSFTVERPVSRTQLNAGSFVPAVLEMAINSDLPGLVTARVRETVYASVNNECELIPAGSKIVGSYDSKIALGQARQLVVWNRIQYPKTRLYPDGAELNLAGMPTADVSGQSGLEADVDNHWGRLFGVALGMTAVTAGVQVSVSNPPTTSANGTVSQPTNSQVVSTALTQQFGQLGARLMGKYLNVQPTLRNYPGERFNIIVPKTIIFPGCFRG